MTRSGRPDYRRVSAALEALISPDQLTSEEHELWLIAFTEKMSEPSEAEKAFFARRRQLGLGVGLNEDGKIVRGTPE